MLNNFWKTKNSFAAKSITNAEAKDKPALAKRLTFRHPQNDQLTEENKNQDSIEVDIRKQSNFEQLKKQIRYLENSQIMSMKYQSNTEPQTFSGYQFKNTGKQFFPSKKVAHFEKYKLYLKKKGRSKRLSFLLDSNQKYSNNIDYQCLDSLKVKDQNIDCKAQIKLKKKETPYIVKKFYRPMTSNKSLTELETRSAEVRGRKLKTSVTNRRNKQNVLICCY